MDNVWRIYKLINWLVLTGLIFIVPNKSSAINNNNNNNNNNNDNDNDNDNDNNININININNLSHFYCAVINTKFSLAHYKNEH